MLNIIKKSMQYNQSLDMIYIDDKDQLTKRRVKPIKISGYAFVAYCFVRKSRRTFKVDGVLAAVPVLQKESMVV